jgi:hypothetical protein
MYGGLGRGFWQAGQVFALDDLRSKVRIWDQAVMPMPYKIDEPAGKAEETANEDHWQVLLHCSLSRHPEPSADGTEGSSKSLPVLTMYSRRTLARSVLKYVDAIPRRWQRRWGDSPSP